MSAHPPYPQDPPLAAPVAPPENGAVMERLFREGHAFDFFQAVRLLERQRPDAPPPGDDRYTNASVRFRAHNGLAFPASDLRDVQRGSNGEALVTATFMGLYGVASPLPAPYHEEVAQESEGGAAIRAFLDLFDHRLYGYFYQAWKKYRPTLAPGRHAAFFERVLLSLAGLGTPGAVPAEGPPASQLAAFAGRLGSMPRNADGLRALVRDALGGVAVRVVENVGRWVTIPERARVGRGSGLSARLGTTATIGARVFDVCGKFRLVLSELSMEQYQSLLPGAPRARRLAAIVGLYAPDYLDYDVELQLEGRHVGSLRLGDRAAHLGQNTWLGRPRGVVSDIVHY